MQSFLYSICINQNLSYMSYDIYLKERASGEVIRLPVRHVMTGGIYQADYDPVTDTFSPAAINEAWLNITYNYGHYYYESVEDDERFYGKKNRSSHGYHNFGIRGIYGKTGVQSISMLSDMASRIENRYKSDGEWITRKRVRTVYRDLNGEEIDPICVIRRKIQYTEEQIEYELNEGPNEDYWTDTAANAIKPLYQLLAFAQLRPDGIWDGD